jgi:membrane protein YdbS with pleckstrin-like domain
MFERLRTVLLRLLRVPPEPEPPFGAPGSVRVFRASRNFYRLRLLGWGVRQFGALVGILFSLWFLHQVEAELGGFQQRQALATNTPPAALAATNKPPVAQAGSNSGSRRRGANQLRVMQERLTQAATKWPHWILPLLSVIEFLGLGGFALQAFLTYAAVRLDFELRWYVVTDRSLRIRRGLWSVQEITMSFANLQQVMVSQGPVQRLLGIADVRLESAGGGRNTHDPHETQTESMHTGIFHGVDNATEVRDLILTRLRSFRETGLGDPDEAQHSPTPVLPPAPAQSDALAAAHRLLAETRALRAVLEPR